MHLDSARKFNGINELVEPYEFFRIQEIFAKKLAEITGMSLVESLLKYTTFYKRIGVQDWEHNINNILWQEYLQKIHSGTSPSEAAYSMYLIDFQEVMPTNKIRECFSYNYYPKERTVHIHFRNNFANSNSPLSDENMQDRIDELKNIFTEVKRKYPEAEKVMGGSWLYSYETYRRLFPHHFTESMIERDNIGHQGNAIWGQFLQSNGELNESRANEFLQKVETARTKEDLFRAFPIKFYETIGDVKEFYEFLDI